MLSIISSVIGLAGSTVPSLISMWNKKSDQKHELKMIQAQAEVQAQIGAARLEETKVEADADKTRALYRHDSAIMKRAAPWTVTLSATVRPVVTYLVILTWVGLEVSAAIALTNEGVGIIDAIDKALSEELKALLSLIIAFWFGNRSLEKIRG
jgi:hypothetical protein